MNNKVAIVAATPDSNLGKRPPPPRPESRAAVESTPQTPDPADLRLVIEEDKASGSYVYKTVDRRTGEVIMQLPREQILKMREQLDYEAGDVVSAKA
jgi:flagellar protein FlaG